MKDTPPLFSIITPTFRRPSLLRRNLLSVLSQTISDYEHIIIDDASDNETLDIIKAFESKRIKLLQHSEQRGAAACYNTGIQNSIGRYICFLDDDDEYLPDYLEKMNNAFSLTGSEVGFIWTGIIKVLDTDEGERSKSIITWPSEFSKRAKGLAAATSIGNGFGLCVKRECIDENGLFDEKLFVCSDTDFLFRLAKKYSFRTIPEPLVKIHQHNLSQLTGYKNDLERIRTKEIILERYSDVIEKYRLLQLVHFNGYANLCYKTGLKKKGRKAIWSMIRKRPLRILTYSDFFAYELTGKNSGNTFLGITLKRLIKSLKSQN